MLQVLHGNCVIPVHRWSWKTCRKPVQHCINIEIELEFQIFLIFMVFLFQSGMFVSLVGILDMATSRPGVEPVDYDLPGILTT